MNYELAITSEKILLSMTNTKLLSKLEILSKENSVLKYYIAGYVFYNEEKINLSDDKHSNLIKLKNKFSAEIKKKKETVNKFHDINIEILVKSESKLRNHLTKGQAHIFISKVKNELKLSYNKLFKILGVSYSNGYNFFVKEDYSKISIKKLHEGSVNLKKYANQS